VAETSIKFSDVNPQIFVRLEVTAATWESRYEPDQFSRQDILTNSNYRCEIRGTVKNVTQERFVLDGILHLNLIQSDKSSDIFIRIESIGGLDDNLLAPVLEPNMEVPLKFVYDIVQVAERDLSEEEQISRARTFCGLSGYVIDSEYIWTRTTYEDGRVEDRWMGGGPELSVEIVVHDDLQVSSKVRGRIYFQ